MTNSYAGPERRQDATLNERVHHLERSNDALWREFNAMRAEVSRNTALTTAIKDDTAELVTLLKGSKLTARLVKWAAALGASVVAIWAAVARWKGGA